MPSWVEHHGNGMFRRGDGIAEGRVHHHHTGGRRGGGIDIVDTDTGPANDLQVRRLGQNLFRHLGRGPDGEAVIITDDLKQFISRQAGFEIGLQATRAENLHGGGAQLV